MRKAVGAFAGIALLLSAVADRAGGAPTPRRPPNIIFILLDNVGQEWFGCYGSEEKVTPNIDALAHDGARFRHCYTPPVCSPSRVVLLTGRYPFRTGWTLHHDAALYGGGGLDPKREITFGSLLRQAGYATGIVGKWQINHLYNEPGILRRHGFDEHLVWPGSIDRAALSAEAYQEFLKAAAAGSGEKTKKYTQHIEGRYWDPVFLRNERRETHESKFGPDLAQQFALDFLQRHRDHPFLLYYPMVLTHGRTFTDPVVATPLNRKTDRPRKEMFADMVRYADRQVGEIVKRLEKLQLRDRTIVFVATDNGTERGVTARCNGRDVAGGLYALTEAGLDVPLIVNCPALVPGGRVGDLADFTDVLPTLADLAGVQLAGDRIIDGRSLAPFLLGQANRSPREWIFNQYHTRRVVRDARYKLFSTGEFFDLERDPEERNNLAASPDPAVVMTRVRLEKVLNSLPRDVKLPFAPRSQSAFRLRTSEPGRK